MTDSNDKRFEVQEAVVAGGAVATEKTAPGCLIEGPVDPCTIVIFGGSGDLTARKLVPALYNLYLNNGLPSRFAIVGVARTEMSHEAFRDRLADGILKHTGHGLERWPEFSAHIFYQEAIYDSLDSLDNLAAYLRDLDERHDTGGNRIFYMATPPSVFRQVGDLFGRSGLAAENESGHGWARIVVEKPFSHNLESAIELNGILRKSFTENQIFRIDHYVAKETVQNLLMFRFANAIFEPIWNRRYVDYVSITAAETLGVEHRAGYYEQAGVLRDMFQNHILQLLAMSAMEPPSSFEADRVRDEKVKVFRSLRPFPVGRLSDYLVMGQYGPGKIKGEVVPGYREEPGVDPASTTPTFAMMKVFIDNWRWQGVPFYLASGKRLPKKVTKIVIGFKRVPHSMFRHVLPEEVTADQLILGIQPDESITLTFQTKNPGAVVCLRTVRMAFDYLQDYAGPVLDAYEKALLDCMQGEHMLFWRQDAVELTWSFISPIIEACEICDDPAELLHDYEAGLWGPPATSKLLGQTDIWGT